MPRPRTILSPGSLKTSQMDLNKVSLEELQFQIQGMMNTALSGYIGDRITPESLEMLRQEAQIRIESLAESMGSRDRFEVEVLLDPHDTNKLDINIEIYPHAFSPGVVDNEEYLHHPAFSPRVTLPSSLLWRDVCDYAIMKGQRSFKWKDWKYERYIGQWEEELLGRYESRDCYDQPRREGHQSRRKYVQEQLF